MKRTLVTLLSLLVILAGTIIYFQSVRAEEPVFTPAEEWGMVDGNMFFTSDTGDIITIEPNVARSNSVETTNSGSITVEQAPLGVIEIGGTLMNNVTTTLTINLPEGNNYLFVGNTYGCNANNICTGTWLPNATITGAEGCTIVNNGQSTQMHCPNVGTEGQTMVLTGRAIQPAEAPPVVTDPYITIATNPSPDGGDYTEWNGVWGSTLYLPITLTE